MGAISFSATGLPAGLSLNASTGAITGTPTADGSFTVAVTATAATSGTATASYSLTIAPAPPVLTSITPSSGPIEGNTNITITGKNLTGVSSLTVGGVAATAVVVISDTQITASTPANPAGIADIAVTTPGGSAVLPAAFTYIAPTFVFSPAAGAIPGGTAGVEYSQTVTVTGGTAPYSFSGAGLPAGISIDPSTGTISGLPTTPGTYSISVTVRDQSGMTGTVTYSLALDGVYRPDPSEDAEVIGLVNAQVQSAQRFATVQMRNFNDRLERLHIDSNRGSHSINIRLGVAQSASPSQLVSAVDELSANTPSRQGEGSKGPQRIMNAGMSEGDAPPMSTVSVNTSFWVGGTVDFGRSDEGNVNLENTLVGVSGGVDYRLTPNFVAGLGLGYGRDKTDIGSNGTDSIGHAFSAALYGSYHPAPFYLDGLVGITRLDFESMRHVTTTGRFAAGEREGMQVFGSLSAGYEHHEKGLLFSPYGRIQVAFTRLDAFTETGAAAYDLSFDKQRFDMLAGVFGLRTEYVISTGWALLIPRGRLEYTHDFAGSSQARIGYSDLGTSPYTLSLERYMRDYLTVGLGIDAKLRNSLIVSLDYRTAFGMGGNDQNHTFGVRFGGNF